MRPAQPRHRASTAPVLIILALVAVLVVGGLVGFLFLSARAPARPAPPPPATTANPPVSGGSGGGPVGMPPAQPAGDVPPAALVTIPQEELEAVNYPLQQSASWPTREEVKPLASLPEDKRPDQARRGRLVEEAQEWLARSLLPAKPEEALGVDGEGRLFLKLGASGRSGLLTQDQVDKMQTLSINRPIEVQGADGLKQAIEATFCQALVEELRSGKAVFRAFEKKAGKASGTYRLDPSGCGAYFPYLYVYQTDEGLLAVLQQVPHRLSPPPAKGE